MSNDPDTSTSVDLTDVMSLSVIELYILHYLIRIAGSVVRFTVLKEINSQLGSDTLSRSSFYNSLENLEKLGFVEIDYTKSGRKSSVKALPKAKEAVRQVNIFNIWGSVDPDAKFKQLIERKYDLFARYSAEPASSQLVLSLQYPANQEILELLSANFKSVKLLGDETTIGPLAEDYDLVAVDAQGIVERNGIFDQVVLYRYAYNELRFDFEFELLITEALRVLKPGGTLVCLALEDLRTTNNLILESGIGMVLEETLETQSTGTLRQILQDHEDTFTSWSEQVQDGLSMITVTK